MNWTTCAYKDAVFELTVPKGYLDEWDDNRWSVQVLGVKTHVDREALEAEALKLRARLADIEALQQLPGGG